MSNISLNSQTNNNYKTAAKITALGATAGAAINGADCFLRQKSVLANPDEFIKRGTESIETLKKQGVSEKVLKAANEVFEKSKEMIAKGKIDFSAVGKRALGGAALFGAAAAVVGLIVSHNKKAQTQETPNKNLDSMA